MLALPSSTETDVAKVTIAKATIAKAEFADAAAPSVRGVYFDGITSARHIVTVTSTGSGIEISDAAGNPIAQWPYPRLAHLNAPAHVFRLGLRDSDRLQRLDIDDAAFAHRIDLACPDIDRTDAAANSERRSVVAWSLAAIASLLLVAFYGLPQIANQIARLLPHQVEQHLGRVGDLRFRTAYDDGPSERPFECGEGPGEIEGKQAFDALMARIAKAAGLTIPIHAVVVRRTEPNAFALAGGYIYVLQGLIDNAKDVDEVAAVIAHELGHVANRDGIRSVLQSGGLSLIFGMILGDFVGGAAVVIAAQMLLKAAYSRQQEAAADDFAVHALQELNANPRALATFLDRVARNAKPSSIFLGHPSVPERVARINAIPLKPERGAPLLSDVEWDALRRICSGYPKPPEGS
jgi:Zn-dependent protease with chaperone function